MKESNINNGFNNYRSSMDVASDDYDNIIDERQDNTLQSSIELVKNVNTCSQDTHVQIQMNTSAVRATNEHVTASDTLIRLKQHKWSILAFICGVILTLGIVVPVMMSKSSSTEKDAKTDYAFLLRFDRKSTHSTVFLSDDDTVLSNFFSKETPNAVNHPEQFNTYKGTIGDRCLTSTSKIYFEIMFSFEIISSLKNNSTDLVVEVGVISSTEIDKYFYAGTNGWSFSIHNCLSYICLTAQHSITRTDEPIKIISSSNTAGTVVTGRLGFFVNMNRNEFSVIDKANSKILYTLNSVVSADQLCFAFGVYNPQVLESTLEILYSYDFTTLPIINVVA
ncbi:unnamed protein product [Mytilus edulis]|uniref:B30.2/SPRY domain-containing protein n=1 Tax=Mytilus edulis TaxID=6550 RepID=A0A8S3RWP3_MYTED|nr:unnamed protein product [Mytilus edulis]